MSFASSSLTQLSAIKEATWGVTPNSGNPRYRRFTGESLKFSLTKDTSKEINPSRQVSSLIPTKAEVAGGLSIELSLQEHDDFMESAMMDSWDHFGTSGISTAALASFPANNTLEFDSAPTGSDALANLSVGDWFRIVDPAGNALLATNKGIFQVVSKTATDIVVSGTPFTVDAVSKNVQIASSKLTHGITRSSYSIEKYHPEAGQYFVFRGMQVSKLSLRIESGSIVNGSVDFMGSTSENGGTSFMPGAASSAFTGDSLNAVTGVMSVLMDGVPIRTAFQTEIKSFNFDFDNKLQGLEAVGFLGNADVMAGRIDLKGAMQVYFANGQLYNDFINSVAHSLTFVLKDPKTGEGYVFEFPRIELADAQTNAQALDQPVMLDTNWQALEHPTLHKSMFIYRV